MFKRKRAVVCDLDGTLILGEEAVEGAIKVVDDLVWKNHQVFYLTNNSGKTQRQIVQKLNKLGFDADISNTYCGSYAISMYLARNKIVSVYAIGTEGLVSDLKFHGIKVENSSAVSAVVVGFDPQFSYEKITKALEAIEKGAKLIIANSDPSYPVENNRRLPGCGAMVGAIIGATGHPPDFQAGKPETYMLELLCKDSGLSASDICVVGDGIESDIAMADKFQCQSILFDPEGAFPEFSGNKVRELHEIISLLN